MTERTGPDVVAEQRTRVATTLKSNLSVHPVEEVRNFFNQHNDRSRNAIIGNVAGVIVATTPDELQTFVTEQINSNKEAKDKKIKTVLTGPIDSEVLDAYRAVAAETYRTLSGDHLQDRPQEIAVARHLAQELQDIFHQPEDMTFRDMRRRTAILLSQLSVAVHGQNYHDMAGQRQVTQNLKARLGFIEGLTTIAFLTAHSQRKNTDGEANKAEIQTKGKPDLDTTLSEIDSVLLEEDAHQTGGADRNRSVQSGTLIEDIDTLLSGTDS